MHVGLWFDLSKSVRLARVGVYESSESCQGKSRCRGRECDANGAKEDAFVISWCWAKLYNLRRNSPLVSRITKRATASWARVLPMTVHKNRVGVPTAMEISIQAPRRQPAVVLVASVGRS